MPGIYVLSAFYDIQKSLIVFFLKYASWSSIFGASHTFFLFYNEPHLYAWSGRSFAVTSFSGAGTDGREKIS